MVRKYSLRQKVHAPMIILARSTASAIGGGFPMALGAAIACPDRKVILVQADGSGMRTVHYFLSCGREEFKNYAHVLKNETSAERGLEKARVPRGALKTNLESTLDLT